MLADTRRELSLRGKEGLKNSKHGPLDVALWNCVCLFELRIEMNDGDAPTLNPARPPACPRAGPRPRAPLRPTTPTPPPMPTRIRHLAFRRRRASLLRVASRRSALRR